VNSSTDEELIARIVRGESRVYGVIVDRHKDRAMTLAVRLLRNREEAEEALQDAFVRAFRAIETFDGRSRFATWLYRIVYNTCLTRLNRLQAAGRIFAEADGEIEISSYETPDVALLRTEQYQQVNGAIAALPEHFATVLTLFYVQEMSYDEIVEITGMPLGTVKTHLFRARTALKKSLLFREPIDLLP
jgi:RNA polymerase sigma-70 factor (ECF subfamily)